MSDDVTPPEVAVRLLAAHLQQRADDRLALFAAGWRGGEHEEAYRHPYRVDLFPLLTAAAGDALRSIAVAVMPAGTDPETAWRRVGGLGRLPELLAVVEEVTPGKRTGQVICPVFLPQMTSRLGDREVRMSGAPSLSRSAT